MKIIGIAGSPRANSNSTFLATKVLETAKEMGAETELFHLKDLNYSGCQACMGCKGEKSSCVVDDDLINVLNAMNNADAILMASPLFYGDVSGQFKCFWDRTYSLIDSEHVCRLKPGIKTALLISQAAPEGSFDEVLEKWKMWFDHYKFDHKGMIAPNLSTSGDAADKSEFDEKLTELAKHLMS